MTSGETTQSLARDAVCVLGVRVERGRRRREVGRVDHQFLGLLAADVDDLDRVVERVAPTPRARLAERVRYSDAGRDASDY